MSDTSLATTAYPARRYRLLMLPLLDVIAVMISLRLAFALRFDTAIPPEFLRRFSEALPFLILWRLLLTLGFGLHRWSFRFSGLREGFRLAQAVLLGSAGLVAWTYFLHDLLPRSVIVLDFFFTLAGMALPRYLPRLAAGWHTERKRSRRPDSARTLIIGAGSAGDLLLRDLQHSVNHRYQVIGFIDDQPEKLGTFLNGRPVLGPIRRLRELIRQHRIQHVLIAIPRLPAARIREILKLCATLQVQLRIIPASFAARDPGSNSMLLHELCAEDLLPRVQISFNREEARALVSGRRVLVTGAAGSIGGEIVRQVASHGPASLVMVDINENELYLRYRRLLEAHPELAIHAEVADIREPARLLQLGARYQPQDVFHAAAHKHVPLMETAPGEAIRNNVLGTIHVAQMADRCGTERFVFISTDKAVRPSSVMGATKRVGELVVRDFARHSKTQFTAVRFGNVIGSAGSVVPLFKQQIEAGGPVTVTHPDCSRYFMTINEAVGLVLVAGLGAYGELCILEMGQAIRIAELAEHMITMAGRVVGADIQIEYTGLRPGEKLTEEIMTEEEEQIQVKRDKIHVTTSPAPPENLQALVRYLLEAAERGDGDEIREALATIVPSCEFARPQRLPPPVSVGRGVESYCDVQ